MYKKIIDMALRSVFNKYLSLVKALAIYLILTISIDYINLNNIAQINGEVEINNGFLFFITLVISYIIYLLVAISTHRILILGENSIPKWGLYKLTERELSFFVNGLLLGLIIVIVMPVSLLGSIFGYKVNYYE